MGAYEDLRARSDSELISLYDHAMGTVVPSLALYRDELLRRESVRSANELIKLTRELRSLTVTVAAATIVALALAVVGVLVR
jgi:hypothetical protein